MKKRGVISPSYLFNLHTVSISCWVFPESSLLYISRDVSVKKQGKKREESFHIQNEVSLLYDTCENKDRNIIYKNKFVCMDYIRILAVWETGN
jgi:hypothetical protein